MKDIVDQIIEDRELNHIYENSLVYAHGEKTETLSESLVMKQKLEPKDIIELKAIHIIRLNLFDMFEAETTPARQRKIVPLMEELEFRLQKVWKFEQDRNKHSWWFQVPHCTCPKIDNWEGCSVGRRIINSACPVHGETNED